MGLVKLTVPWNMLANIAVVMTRKTEEPATIIHVAMLAQYNSQTLSL